MFTIRRTQIIGTNQLVFTAWEPMADLYSHSSVMLSLGLGKVTARSLDTDVLRHFDADTRVLVVKGYQDKLAQVALDAILAEYPWLKDAGTIVGGDIHATTDLEAQAA